jgi:co-chaperonin GroES (HSP10)
VRILPTGDRILVKPIEESTSKGGIVLPDQGREKPNRGVVVDTGPMVQRRRAK